MNSEKTIIMRIKLFLLGTVMLLAASCGRQKTPQPFSVIPYPQEVEFRDGYFDIAGAGFTVSDGIDARTIDYIESFADRLKAVSGKRNVIRHGTCEKGVVFSLDETLGPEAYTVDVTHKCVSIAASTYNGFVYALQTIGQMLPAEFYGGTKVKADFVLPCVSIYDAPRFSYRGVLLDVGRHFYSVDEVKRFLDIMSVYKANVFHWHLTEDQGWRMEVKKYPRLTEIGSLRHGTQIDFDPTHLRPEDHGGYYTQDEMREVVAYAARLGITVIPELDLPGHMLSALAAYPELGCTGGPYEVANTWGVKKDVLCAGKEETFAFLEDILTEMMDIFPSEYINIGGDEVPKVRWKECPHCQARIKELGLKDKDGHTAEQYLQNYVTARIQAFLAKHGRKIIGWEEILEGELAEGVTVMSWKGTVENVDERIWNYNSIMSPRGYMYIDRYQSHEQDREPFSIGAYLPVERVYEYEPYKGVPEYGKARIMGVQANLWTEYVNSDEYLEYMLLPRLAALSEVQWCTPENRQYPRFVESMDHHRGIYEQKGLTYAKHLWGIVGLPGAEYTARTQKEIEEYWASQE